jgi:hypothetical protein
MISIVFIYKIKNIDKTHYGKYLSSYISDDHDGLDDEISSSLLFYLNKYRKQQKLENDDITVGIISCSKNDYLHYTTDNEIKCFDFYYKSYNFQNEKVYFNGIEFVN